ncbi:hypothetical protein LB503_011435 [Fusarium chuoi]|nr:hypothetical protein LB503_011435 [Fusarium chuoi]
MTHSQKPQPDRPDVAQVESLADDNKIPPTAEYHPDELVKSKFDSLSIPRTVWIFRRVALVALAVYTGYVCEGFEVSDSHWVAGLGLTRTLPPSSKSVTTSSRMPDS